MNPYLNAGYADTITAALLGTTADFPTGNMSFVQTDFPVAGRSVVARDATPTPTTQTQDIVSARVAPQEARKPDVVNPGYATQTKGNGGQVGSESAEFKGSGLTAFQIKHYMEGAADVIQAGENIANGYLAYNSAYMRGKSLEFEAGQHERNAQLLYKNMREINRAADADANVYRVRGAQHKSDQRVAMAASGFAVGKGVYKNTLQSTDVRTEYNVALLKLKAGLQNAEILRQIGVEDAQAIIKKAEASISRKYGRANLASGISSGIANIMSAGANFYMGYKGEGATKGGNG